MIFNSMKMIVREKIRKDISKIHYITNGQSRDEILDEVNNAVIAGIDWVQLRIKDPALDFLTIAKEVRDLCRNKAIFIVNDNVEVASEINADGVHLGKDDLPVDEARLILGYDNIIGGTANTLADCKNLEKTGADYIGLGPFRETKTKEKLSPILGLDGYRRIVPKDEEYGWTVMSLNTPVLAIGGILPEDVYQLKDQTAIHGIAASGMIKNAADPKNLIRELQKILS